MKNETQNIYKYCRDRMKKFEGTVAHSDMEKALTFKDAMGGSLVKILEHVAYYCEAHQRDYGSFVGDDGYLEPYVKDILQGIIGLLSGPGRFDGGTLDSFARDLADAHQIELDR